MTLKHFSLFFLFGSIGLTPTKLFADTYMTCDNVPGWESRRYYRMTYSSASSQFETKLKGQWIELCSQKYLPLNQKMKSKPRKNNFELLEDFKRLFSSEPVVYNTLLNITTGIRDKAHVCKTIVLVEPENGSSYKIYNEYVIDFEVKQYEWRRNTTGSFQYRKDYKETIIPCK